jgi:hypothetical protein
MLRNATGRHGNWFPDEGRRSTNVFDMTQKKKTTKKTTVKKKPSAKRTKAAVVQPTVVSDGVAEATQTNEAKPTVLTNVGTSGRKWNDPIVAIPKKKNWIKRIFWF